MFRVGLSRLAGPQNVRSMSTATGLPGKVTVAVEKVKQFLQSEQTKFAVKAALIELRPPTPAEIPKAIGDAVRLFRGKHWKHLTVREAWLNTLVTTEVICWFFVGEVIGKGTLIGYQV